MSQLQLTNLHLQNFATFETQKISFDNGFNAIVGETGSGKSLVLDALQLIFGARADKQIIRKNSTFASIEASFKTSSREITQYFDQLGFPSDEDEIIVKRIIYLNGKTKAFINHQSANISMLSSFSKRFIDLVGQFENQKLLSEDYQMLLLDSYANLKQTKSTYHVAYNNFHTQQTLLNSLLKKQDHKIQRQDFLRYQLDEIETLNPSLDDEISQLAQKDSLLNHENKRQVLSKALSALSEGEGSNILSALNTLTSQLQVNDSFICSDDLNNLFKASQLIEEVSYNISKEIDDENIESKLEEIIDRLDIYQRLKRKFGGSTESLIDTFHLFKKEYNDLAELDVQIATTKEELRSLEAQAYKIATTLHDARITAANDLSQKLTYGVRKLMMKGATIELSLSTNTQLGPSGISSLTLEAETNPGEGYFNLKKVASGGELSRILLTLRQLVAANDSISIFLFDEIDTGIGGETAICTGKALAEVSLTSQVIAITHLPQIAHQADKLITVEKSTSEKTSRTHSLVFEYHGDEKNIYVQKMSQLN